MASLVLSKVAVLASSKNTDEGNKCSPMLSDSLLADGSKKWRGKVPVGIRFKPTEQVLVCHYLARKVSGCTDGPIFQLIKDVDVYQCDPSQLSSLAFWRRENVLFHQLTLEKEYEYKVPAGGFWKKIANPSFIEGKDGKPMANKRTLVYYKKLDEKSNPIKTQWLTKEYMLLDNQSPNQNDEEYPTYAPWTLCVAYADLKRRRMNEKESSDEKNNLSSDLFRNTTCELNPLASNNKQNSDNSVKRSCKIDDKCRRIELSQSL